MGEKLIALAEDLFILQNLKSGERKRLQDFSDEHPMARYITLFHEALKTTERMGTIAPRNVDAHRGQLTGIVVSIAFGEPEKALNNFNRHFVTTQLFGQSGSRTIREFKNLDEIPSVPTDAKELQAFQKKLGDRIIGKF